MPFGSIQVKPGVNTVATPTLNSAGISKSNLVRFRGGLPEKLGGWSRFITSSLDSITRALHAWKDNNSNKWLAAGNLNSLNVISGPNVQDITPQYKVTNPIVNISTVAGSTTVTINDLSIGLLTTYDSVYFNTPVSIGGLILSGLYPVTGTPVTARYTITAGLPATSTVNNGGAVPQFTATSGSANVTVRLVAHGLSVGSKFYFPVPTNIGGVSISGVMTVASVIDVDNFVIAVMTKAAASASAYMNSGNAQYLYYLSVGPSLVTGSGVMGPIASNPIAAGYTSGSIATQTGAAVMSTDWTLDNWGDILLACSRGGPVYYWNPSSGFSTAVAVGTGPPQCNGIFIAMPAQILVTWGSASTLTSGNTSSALDPLIVRWSDQLNFTNWVVSSRTQAGSFHIPTGSEIRGGIQGANAAYIFTDVDVWSMTYIGYPLVFSFNNIYSSDGLVGPHAVTDFRGSTFWMGNNNFYMVGGGGVNLIPCPVWDNVFQDLDRANANKCVAAANDQFSEVWFFYPSVSGGTGECDKYVKVNISEGFVWDYGTMSRSAWQSYSVLGQPIGADPTTRYLQQHETSYGADGAAMDSYFETGFFPYGDGETFSVIDHFEPDMKFTTSNSSTPSASISVTLTAVNYPTDTASMVHSSVMTSTTEYISPRVRGRQAKWKIETNDATSWWRVGNTRYRFNPGGRR